MGGFRDSACKWMSIFILKKGIKSGWFQWFSFDVQKLWSAIYPENLNVAEQQTSEIFEFKKTSWRKRMKKKELSTDSVLGLPLKTLRMNFIPSHVLVFEFHVYPPQQDLKFLTYK